MSCHKLVLDNIGKKFQYKWIFKDVDCQLQTGDVLSVRGNNGAGKSTLLKIISGHLSPNQGQVLYSNKNNEKIDRDTIYSQISFAAPYINLLSRLNLEEILDFYQRFKPLRSGLDTAQLIKLTGLKAASHKQLRFYSSGMLQRVKLAMAICAESSVLILDEPTTNLDDAGVKWYQETLKAHNDDRIIIIASNVEHDFEMCNKSLSILDYKKKENKLKAL